MARVLMTALVLVPFFLASAQEPDVPARQIEQIAESFIALASHSWPDLSVCEHRSKADNKRAFLRRSFEKELFPDNTSISWKEMQVSEEGTSTALHLGIVAVTFQDPEKASAVHNRLSTTERPYLKGTKISTRYKVLLRKSTVFILYSETFHHEMLRRFFEAVTLPP